MSLSSSMLHHEVDDWMIHLCLCSRTVVILIFLHALSRYLHFCHPSVHRIYWHLSIRPSAFITDNSLTLNIQATQWDPTVVFSVLVQRFHIKFQSCHSVAVLVDLIQDSSWWTCWALSPSQTCVCVGAHVCLTVLLRGSASSWTAPCASADDHTWHLSIRTSPL